MRPDAGDRQGVWWSGVDAAIAEAPMKAQRRLGLDLSWPRITSAFLLDVGTARPVTSGGQTVAWCMVSPSRRW